jgi:hypothetical protein
MFKKPANYVKYNSITLYKLLYKFLTKFIKTQNFINSKFFLTYMVTAQLYFLFIPLFKRKFNLLYILIKYANNNNILTFYDRKLFNHPIIHKLRLCLLSVIIFISFS